MTPDMQAQIDRYALAFAKLTGFQFKARGVIDPRTQGWFHFIQAGFTIDDMDTVIVWLKRRVREGKRDIACLRWSRLIADPVYFEEELELAKAEKRNMRPMPTPKERVIQQARPVIGEQTSKEINARNAQDVAIAALRQLKKDLFGTEK